MDILEQYNKTSPAVTRRILSGADASEHGLLIRAVMRMSGGLVADARRANMILLVIAVAACVAAIAVIAANFNIRPRSGFTEEDARKQLEEYREVQPF